MRISLIGKVGSVTHWLEDCAADLALAGHQVRITPTRNPKLGAAIERLLLAPGIGAPRASLIARSVRAFAPDLVVAVKGFDMPVEVLQRLRSRRDRPPLLGWVGDRFSAIDRTVAELYDVIGYTDSFFLEQHADLGFNAPCVYLPHAASRRLGQPDTTVRIPRLVFVANPTPHRLELLDRLRTPIELFGPGWPRTAATPHVIHHRRLSVAALGAAYRSHIGVLNIRHEANVERGLNQRSFDPYVLATPVVSDDQPDLAMCFQPGQDVLVYRSLEELEDICRRLRAEPQLAARIGQAGHRLVMSRHLYHHRIEHLAASVR